MRMTRLAVATVSAILAASTLNVSAASAATLPGVVVNYWDSSVVKIKPKTIQPYKDIYYSGLRWTTLTTTVGYATGIRHINTCNPSCADANYMTDKVRMKFTKVRTTPAKKRVFSQVEVTVVDTHPLPVNDN